MDPRFHLNMIEYELPYADIQDYMLSDLVALIRKNVLQPTSAPIGNLSSRTRGCLRKSMHIRRHSFAIVLGLRRITM